VLAAFAAPRSYFKPLRLFERPAAAAETHGAKSALKAKPALKQSAQDRPARSDQADGAQERPAMPERQERPTVRVLKSLAGTVITVGGASGFPLPAGKSVTIMFSVTVNTPFPNNTFQVCNQGTVSGSNFSDVLTNNVCTPVCVAGQASTPLSNQTVCQGNTTTFSTTVTGNAPFSFVWKQNGTTVTNGGLSGRATIATNTVSNSTTSTLTISNTMLADATSYTADATSVACGTTVNQSATLTVNQTTATTALSPQGSCAGGTANFSTTASGTGPFTFVWKKGTTPLSNGGNITINSTATTSSLSIGNVQAADAATYSVETTGACNTATQSAALTVNQTTATTALLPQAVCAGGTANFSTTASGPGPFSFVWKKGGVPLSSGGNIAISSTATASSLSISNAQAADAATYSVEMTGACNTATQSAALTLNQNTATTALSPQTVCTGGTASFSTTASGTGPFTFVWKKGGVALSSGGNIAISSMATTSSLQLSNVQAADAATYSVEATGACNTDTQSAALMVNQSTATSAPSPQTVCPGGTANFSTMASGLGPFTFVWKKGGVALSSGGNITINSTATTSSLQISSAQAADAATYSIETTGACNTATQSAALTVNQNTATTAPSPQAVCPAGTANFSTTASGTGPFSFVWKKGGVALSNGGNITISSTATTSSLSVSNAQVADAATYSVETTGACNIATQSAALMVTDTQVPVITCPLNQVGVTAVGGSSAVVNFYPQPSATDNCASPTPVCNPPSGFGFSLGTTTVTCTASDNASPPNTAQCMFTVAVRQPSPAIKDLNTRVQALVPATLNQTQANSIITYLNAANLHVQQNLIPTACTDMANAVNQINGLTMPGGPISAAQNDGLLRYANKIRNALGCTCSGGQCLPAKRDVGVFAAQRGEFYLKRYLVTGLAERVERFGEAGDLPVAGDWDGAGIDSVGVFRAGVFHLRPARLADANGNPVGEEITVEFGQPGDLPVVGDWDGDGVTTVGVYRQGQFLLRNSNRPGPADIVVNLGEAGDLPLAGDWDGDGQVTVGVYSPTKGLFRLSNTFKDVLADIEVQWGGLGYLPIVGDWDGDGVTTIGLYGLNGEFLLRNRNEAGPPELVFTLGVRGGLPVAGRWSNVP
jgi:hypothetical protein